MKILNLYAGIGGNRELWGEEYDITAVEINPKIAKKYQERFPKDNVVVADAHEYLKVSLLVVSCLFCDFLIFL